jgi:hypothetical protein
MIPIEKIPVDALAVMTNDAYGKNIVGRGIGVPK